MRQDPCMQHVWIRQHHMALFADGPAGVSRRITVIGENPESVVQSLVQVVKLCQLILRQSFGREKIERASVRILENRIQYRQVVAKRFSRSGWRDHHHVFAGVDSLGSDVLMCVKLSNSLGAVRSDEVAVHPRGKLSPLRFARGKITYRREHLTVYVA